VKVFAAVIAILTLGVIGYFVYQYTMEAEIPTEVVEETPLPMFQEEPSPPAPTEIEKPPAETEVAEAGLGPMPDLESSDAYLDTLFEETEGWRTINTAKHLIRRAVTAVDLISRNENPNSQWNFLQPTTPFETTEKDDKVWISEANYTRYQPMFRLLDQVPVERAALIYQHLYPVAIKAYEELGNGDKAFAEKFDKALQRILDFQPPEGEIEVIGKEGTFIFADPDLEDLSPLEKGLIRIGPAQTRQLQEKIKAFRDALPANNE